MKADTLLFIVSLFHHVLYVCLCCLCKYVLNTSLTELGPEDGSRGNEGQGS